MQDKTIQEFKRNFINIFHEQVFQNLKIFEKERLHAQKEAEKYSNRVAMIVYPLIVIMVAPIGIPLIIFFMFILGKTVFSAGACADRACLNYQNIILFLSRTVFFFMTPFIGKEKGRRL